MIFAIGLSTGGLIAGFLLLRRVPVLGAGSRAAPGQLNVSIIIPARNEERNLPLLLESLRSSTNARREVLVVDDGSTDETAAIATRYGATVIASTPLPEGWTGKTWACRQGVAAATGEALFFLDADVRFVDGGYRRIVDQFAVLPQNAALSILPFHRTQCWYEELSLFFNIVMAMGAGGFGKLNAPHLFGQSLLIHKELYCKAGGHDSVKGEILENFRFAEHVIAAGGTTHTLGGRGALDMRMFPHGLRQLHESWRKAFSTGAAKVSPLVLGLSIYWLATAISAPFLPIATSGPLRLAAAALLYPVALAFYLATFVQSAWAQQGGTPVIWRGRKV